MIDKVKKLFTIVRKIIAMLSGIDGRRGNTKHKKGYYEDRN
jgi:hypothetical protein